MTKWEERQKKLLTELKKQRKLTVEEVKTLLGVSESTARRIIIELEKEQLLIRCFGGIQRIQSPEAEYSYLETEERNAEEKIRIGEYAAGLVEEGDVIYISGGSTLKYMATALKERIDCGKLLNISVVTNSLVSADVLAEKVSVIMPGGVCRKKFQDLAGSMTEKSLRSMCFNKAFLGTVAINENEGFMTADIDTSSIMEAALSKASSFYVLADSGKFGRTSFTSYGKADRAAVIITDTSLEDSVKDSMEAAGCKIICI